MTNEAREQDMLAKALALKAERDMKNVEFVESRITNILLNDGIADCIISNCVVNLVPHNEKQQVFNEIFRLLKPGGRVAISDILAKKPLPDRIRDSMALYVGCVAGASQVVEYEQYLANAGFKGDIVLHCSRWPLLTKAGGPQMSLSKIHAVILMYTSMA